jgi:hypothetical protein
MKSQSLSVPSAPVFVRVRLGASPEDIAKINTWLEVFAPLYYLGMNRSYFMPAFITAWVIARRRHSLPFPPPPIGFSSP